MSKQNENRQGYKKTKAGWIPEEWECKHLGEHLNKIVGGGTPSKQVNQYWNGCIPWATVKDVSKGNLLDTIDHITETGLENSASNLIQADTVIVSTRMAVGASIRFIVDVAINQDLKALYPNKNLLNDFLYWLIIHNERKLAKMGIGSTVDGIRINDINFLVIPLPPLSEQKKISKILSAWDKAIEQVGKLIEAKQKLKEALMQQLLTCKRRFKEFKEIKWHEFVLGDVFKERKETNRSDLPLLSITSGRGVINSNLLDKKDSSTEDKSKYKRIVPGDIGYNTMRMWQGVSALSDLEGIVSPAYTICTPRKQLYGSFAKHLFKFKPMIHVFWRFSQGMVSDTLNLKFHNFEQIKIKIPCVGEQKEMAGVLNTIDREIELLKNKVDKLKKQKKGLMQKLLTGEIRVKT